MNSDQNAPAGDIHFDSSEQLRELSFAMVEKSRRSLDIISRALDPPVYDIAEFVDSVKNLVRPSRARVRIVVLDPVALLARGRHGLVELTMRLSSYMEIRTPGPDHLQFNEALLIADQTAMIHRQFSDRYIGSANFHAPKRALLLSEQFETVWQNGIPDPNFRRLMV